MVFCKVAHLEWKKASIALHRPLEDRVSSRNAKRGNSDGKGVWKSCAPPELSRSQNSPTLSSLRARVFVSEHTRFETMQTMRVGWAALECRAAVPSRVCENRTFTAVSFLPSFSQEKLITFKGNHDMKAVSVKARRVNKDSLRVGLSSASSADDNEFDEDALEALFAQLEMDLEAGGILDDEDLTEEEVIELENELAAALGDLEEEEEEEEEELRIIDVVAEDAETGADDDALKRGSKSFRENKEKSGGQKTRIEIRDEFADAILEKLEDEEDEQRIVSLETWQLRKLAAAVETGRRKVNIKALCAEVGMDRFDVLSWLKNPPPELLMYSTTTENEERLDKEDGASSSSPANSKPAGKQELESDPEGGKNWHSQKRLKKEHQATFERVFSNTHRPSNAMLQNLVELTHVPRKRIVEWFEQRRRSVRASPKFEALR